MAVFAVGARTEEGWDFLLEKYKHCLYTSLKSRIKSALTISPLAHKLKWYVDLHFEFHSCKLIQMSVGHIIEPVRFHLKFFNTTFRFVSRGYGFLTGV